MLRVKFITGLFFVFSVLLVSSQLFAQADVIEKRQKAMKGNSEDVKAIKAAVEAKDYATVDAKAKDIMGTAENLTSLFPKGTTAGKPKPKRKTGKNPDEFSIAPKNLAKASGVLAPAAKT